MQILLLLSKYNSNMRFGIFIWESWIKNSMYITIEFIEPSNGQWHHYYRAAPAEYCSTLVDFYLWTSLKDGVLHKPSFVLRNGNNKIFFKYLLLLCAPWCVICQNLIILFAVYHLYYGKHVLDVITLLRRKCSTYVYLFLFFWH